MKGLLYILISASTGCTVVAQLLLKRVLTSATVQAAMSQGLPKIALAVASMPLAWLALCIQGAGYVVWLAVLSKEKMAIAFAISGSFFYLLVSFAAWALFSEALNTLQWVGITLISLGVLLVASQQ